MFEQMLRLSGCSDIHIEVRKKGFLIRFRNSDGLTPRAELKPHSENLYNEIESYIEAPKGSISSHLKEDGEVILIGQGKITEKNMRFAGMPSCGQGHGCDIVIRLV